MVSSSGYARLLLGPTWTLDIVNTILEWFCCNSCERVCICRPSFKTVFRLNSNIWYMQELHTKWDFFRCHSSPVEGCNIQSNWPIWTKTNLANQCKSWDGKNEAQTKHMTKTQQNCQNTLKSARSQTYGKIRRCFTKIRRFFTCFSLFILVFHCGFGNFGTKTPTHETELNSSGFLEYLSAICSHYFLLGRWTKLQWWGKTIPTQNWLNKIAHFKMMMPKTSWFCASCSL